MQINFTELIEINTSQSLKKNIGDKVFSFMI